MTLADWKKENGNVGSAFGDYDDATPNRPSVYYVVPQTLSTPDLWHLDDYIVTSAIGGAVWLRQKA